MTFFCKHCFLKRKIIKIIFTCQLDTQKFMFSCKIHHEDSGYQCTWWHHKTLISTTACETTLSEKWHRQNNPLLSFLGTSLTGWKDIAGGKVDKSELYIILYWSLLSAADTKYAASLQLISRRKSASYEERLLRRWKSLQALLTAFVCGD